MCVAVAVAVGVAVAVAVAVGVGVGVGVGALDWAQYLPPVLKTLMRLYPPQTIISLPVQTAVCEKRAVGAPLVLVAVQLSVPGSYLPPVFNDELAFSSPPHTIISPPVQTAVCASRPTGAFVVLVGVQLFVPGLYLPPVLR